MELTLALQPATVLLVVVPLALVLCVAVCHFALKVKSACAHKCMHTCKHTHVRMKTCA